MKKILLIAALFTFTFGTVCGQQERDPEYVKVISGRAEKNMENLGITDPQAFTRVKEVIMNHYFTLNDIYSERDSLKKAVKENPESGLTNTFVTQNVDAKLYRHHFAFIADLMLDLDEKQVEEVKNALTYNVLNVTYTATLEMVPSLTEVQKRRIYTWLVEARELAIDAASSKDKHGVFGRYKGRINNYLSQEGYDLVKEREGWYERIKQRESEAKK